MKALTEQQVRDYRQNGFLFPIPVLTPAEAAEGINHIYRLEERIGTQLSKAHKKYRSGSYTFLPWVEAMCRHPRVLDAVEDVIGPDILVFWGTFFIKEAGSPAFTAWHQDSTYFGLDPHEHVTAWIALSDASEQAGCMEVLPPNGAPRQYHHADDAQGGRNVPASHAVPAPLGAERSFTPARRVRHQLHPRARARDVLASAARAAGARKKQR